MKTEAGDKQMRASELTEYSALYARGWLLAANELPFEQFDVPRYFVCKQLGSYYLAYDPRAMITICHADSVFVVLVGLAMDVDRPEADLNYLCAHFLTLFNETRHISPALLDSMDALTGRWALFFIHNENLVCFSDALGLRSIYYHSHLDLCASHYGIIQSYAQERSGLFNLEVIYQQHKKACQMRPWVLPGDLTPYANIFLLVPGFYLELRGHRLTRFFPRKTITEVDIETSAQYLAGRISQIMPALCRHFRPLLALTSGWDSRMSLAGCKNCKDQIQLFTFNFVVDPEMDHDVKYGCIPYDNDLNIAKFLAKTFGMKHTELHLSNAVTNPEESYLFINHYCAHHPTLPMLLMQKHLISANSIYIKSVATEVFRNSYFNVEVDDIDNIAHQVSRWSMYHPDTEIFAQIRDYYKQYLQKYKYNEIFKLGYNYGAVFYIDYRMAMWQAATLMEMDYVADSFVPFNSRKFIEIALSQARESLDRNMLCEKIIEKAWPELNDVAPYPNTIVPDKRYADHCAFFTRGLYRLLDRVTNKPTFKTAASESGLHFIDIAPDFVVFGFTRNYIHKGDWCEVIFPLYCESEKIYYLTLTVLAMWHDYATESRIYYEVKLNDELLYRINTNDFARPNMISYLFKADSTCYYNLNVRIVCERETRKRLHNSIIKINNFMFRHQWVAEFHKPVLQVTQKQFAAI